MPEKRPHADGVENGDTKRSRSNNGSPAPPAATNGALSSNMDEVAQKKAAAAERIAALKAKMAAQQAAKATPAAPSPSSDPAKDAMAAKIAAMRAKLAPARASSSPAPMSPGPPVDAGRSDRLSAQIAQVKAMAAQRRQIPGQAPPPPPEREDNFTRSRGGLAISLHPSLMGDGPSISARGKSGSARQKESETKSRANPYLSQEVDQEEQKNDPNFDVGFSRQRDRKSRQLLFNQKGKFIAQAEALRQQERLEKMKRDIQEQHRKAGLEQATERSYLVQAPPDIEWWDEGLVNGKDYDNLSDPNKTNFEVITQYVQHPVLLEPPQEKNAPAPKAMYLTKTEQKKLRRQRRREDHKEEQAKIRLGLKPPPPPKVKKQNLMRVLGQEAVQDPTAVEARVNRDIAQRADDHEAMNEERKLTKEQRHEKLAAQQEADAAKGIQVSVYKIDNLSYGKHRYQIDVNAKQNDLTGITILNPKMNLVIVEGGAKSISNYRKLMLNRIKWTDNAAPQSVSERNREAEQEWLKGVDERGMVKDLSFNKCTLVWEGEEKAKAFKRWGSRVCETDGEAKDVLGRNKMENMWTLAQSMQ